MFSYKRTVTSCNNWTQYWPHLSISFKILDTARNCCGTVLSILLSMSVKFAMGCFLPRNSPLPPSLERHSWSIECHLSVEETLSWPPPDLTGTCFRTFGLLSSHLMWWAKVVSCRPRTKIRWISLSLDQIHWQVSYDKPFMHSHLGNTISFFFHVTFTFIN
jgi:hypothetical protein